MNWSSLNPLNDEPTPILNDRLLANDTSCCLWEAFLEKLSYHRLGLYLQETRVCILFIAFDTAPFAKKYFPKPSGGWFT